MKEALAHSIGWPDVERFYWPDANAMGGRLGAFFALWHRSYFAGSVGGAPLETVKQYIQQQKTPD